MNIILDPNQVEEYRKKYTVLELDTIKFQPVGKCVTAYCIVDKLKMTELPQVETKSAVHHNLMSNYRQRNWQDCLAALDQLDGFWSGQLDSFYEEIRGRIAKYIDNDPGKDWDATIEKTVTTE